MSCRLQWEWLYKRHWRILAHNCGENLKIVCQRSLLSSMNTWMNSFHQIWKKFDNAKQLKMVRKNNFSKMKGGVKWLNPSDSGFQGKIRGKQTFRNSTPTKLCVGDLSVITSGKTLQNLSSGPQCFALSLHSCTCCLTWTDLGSQKLLIFTPFTQNWPPPKLGGEMSNVQPNFGIL